MTWSDLHTFIYEVEDYLPKGDDAFTARDLLNAIQQALISRYVDEASE